MGARLSEAMLKARKLILEERMTPYAAAKATGITKQAIYMSAWWKDRKK
jgi:hypothetical protein